MAEHMVSEHHPITLVLGGARSGKSRHAQSLAESGWQQPVFLASAEALDDEMQRRIALHREGRGPRWKTIEEPLEVARIFRAPSVDGDVLLWDCATLWLSNVLLKEGEEALPKRQEEAIEALRHAARDVIVVSNEVGLGLVPPYPLGRAFRDAAGRFNQDLAALADHVVLLVAGLPLVLKGEEK